MRRLEQLIEQSEEILGALRFKNEKRALELVNQSRKLRSSIIESRPIPKSADEYSALTRLNQQMQGLDEQVGKWLFHKPEMDASQLAAALIPLAWNLDLDVLVLPCDTADEICHALAQHGQKRIIYVDRSNATAIRTVVEGYERPVSRVFAHRFPESRIAEAEFKQGVMACSQSCESLRSTIDTLRVSGLAMMQNALANERFLDRYAGVPGFRPNDLAMVMVGAGPSLDINVNLLERAKSVALVCAVSHALPALKKAGVLPHVVMAGDPQAITLEPFKGFPTKDCILVTGINAPPETIDLGWKQVLFYSANEGIDSWAGIPEFRTAGSTASVGISLGQRWGVSQLAYIGQDLAFAKGKRYASAIDEIWEPDATHTCDGWNGPVQTSVQMDYMRRWYDHAGQEVKAHVPMRLYNCSEQGAVIPSWNQMAFSTWLDGFHDKAPEMRKAILPLLASYIDTSSAKRVSHGALLESVKLISIALRTETPSKHVLRDRVASCPLAKYMPYLDEETLEMRARRIALTCLPLLQGEKAA